LRRRPRPRPGAVERAGHPGVDRDLEEHLGDLFLGGPGVERDAELTTQRLQDPEGGRDRHGYQCPCPGVEELGARPDVAEGVRRRDPLEIRAVDRFAGGVAEETFQAEAQQALGGVQGIGVSRVRCHVPTFASEETGREPLGEFHSCRSVYPALTVAVRPASMLGHGTGRNTTYAG
jgi:hypothetical protein